MSVHPILRYLGETERSQADFAAATDLSPGLISGIVTGKIIPGRRAALAIVAASGGKITLEELFVTPPAKKTA